MGSVTRFVKKTFGKGTLFGILRKGTAAAAGKKPAKPKPARGDARTAQIKSGARSQRREKRTAAFGGGGGGVFKRAEASGQQAASSDATGVAKRKKPPGGGTGGASGTLG